MKQKKDFEALCVILAFYAVLLLGGITCPIRFLTGISCPGCGMTRAWFSLLKMDLSGAFHYHPLFWLAPVLLVFLFKRESGKMLRAMMVAMGSLFIGTYLYRMFFSGGNIVVFNPWEGLIAKIINIFLGG